MSIVDLIQLTQYTFNYLHTWFILAPFPLNGTRYYPFIERVFNLTIFSNLLMTQYRHMSKRFEKCFSMLLGIGISIFHQTLSNLSYQGWLLFTIIFAHLQNVLRSHNSFMNVNFHPN